MLLSISAFGQIDTLTINVVSGCKDGVPVEVELVLKSVTGATIATYTHSSPATSLSNTDLDFGGFIDFDPTDAGTAQEFYSVVSVANSNAALLQINATFDCSGGLYQNKAYTSVYLDKNDAYTLQIDPTDTDSFGLSKNGTQLKGQLCVDNKEREYMIVSGDTCGVITTETFIDCSVLVDTVRYDKDTSMCITYIESVGHDVEDTHLAAVYHLNGVYTTDTGPRGDTLSPVGLVHEVIDGNNFVLIRCGFTHTTYADGFYYYTDAGISTTPNNYAETPIFIAHNGVASVNIDYLNDKICIEEPTKPFLIDMATLYANEISGVNINGVPVTFDNLNNAVDNGNGSITFTDAGAASSSEYFESGYVEMTLDTDPATQFQSNSGVTFGVSYSDYSISRFTADYEVYLGSRRQIQIREMGNLVFTSDIGSYFIFSTIRIVIGSSDIEYYVDDVLIYTSINGLPDPMCVPVEDWLETQDSINKSLTVIESIFHTNRNTIPTISESDEYFVVPAILSGAIIDRVTYSATSPTAPTNTVFPLVSLTIQDPLGVITQDVGQAQISQYSGVSSPKTVVSEGDIIWLAVDRLGEPITGTGMSATITFVKE